MVRPTVRPVGVLSSSIPSDAYNRLDSQLTRVSRGFDVDLRSPLFSREMSRDEIVARWAEILYPAIDKYPWLVDFEREEQNKIGPMSIQGTFARRKVDLEGYWTQDGGKVSREDLFLRASNLAHNFGVVGPVAPNSIEYAYRSLPSTTNWGLPFVSSNQDYHSDYLERAQEILRLGRTEIFSNLLFWRGSPNGIYPKQRIVWGADHAPAIVAKMFLDPVLDEVKEFPDFAAWRNLEAVDIEVTRFLESGDVVRSIDFSRYDQSLNSNLLLAIRHFFANVYPYYGEILDFLWEDLMTTGIVTPEGVWYGREAGMPSGNVFTNFGDSLAHKIVTEDLGIEATVMGDDGVWLTDMSDVSLVDAISAYGLVVNPEKSYSSKDEVHYLQRVHHVEYQVGGVYVGVASTMRMLGKMLSYEYLKTGWSGEMDTLRWIMQSENCKYHPAFDLFVRYWSSGDKMSLTAPGILLSGAGGVEHVEEVTGKRAFPWLQGDYTRLGQFQTVKILRQLRQS